jgi:chorismate mutase
MTKIDQLRGKIDALDDQIVDLLGERFHLTGEVGELKKKEGEAVYQSGREDAILKRVVARGKKLGLDGLLLQALFLQIFAVSKRKQR